MASPPKQRLIEALELIQLAMKSPNTFENRKEATFSALRRGCLDLRRDSEQMESSEFTTDRIRDAWLFVIELSKAKLRRKHALECIQIMQMSVKWTSVLKADQQIRSKAASLSKEMQSALGLTDSSETSSRRGPARDCESPRTSPVISALSRSSKAVKVEKTVIKEIPISCPVLELDAIQPRLELDEEINPFKKDFNPFKEARGSKEVSNPYARKTISGLWWEQPLTEDSRVWWS